MAYLQLVSYSYGVYTHYIKKIESVETVKIYFNLDNDNYKVNLQRICDATVIKHLVFELQNPDMTISNFTNEINNGLFSLKIYDKEQIDHLSLYANLKPIRKIGNSIIMELPFEYTQQQITLQSGEYCNFEIKITNINTNLFNNVFLTCENYFFDFDFRREIVNYYEKNIQMFQTCVPNYTNGMFETQILDLNLYVKGYFIEVSNYDELNEITLFVNDNIYLTYDKILLDLICHKISDKMIYISFTNTENYKNTELDSYIGSVYHDQMSKVKMCLKFNNLIQHETIKLKVHMLCANVERYVNGIYGYMYGNNRTNLTLNLIKKYENEWYILHELLTDEKICPISYEKIEIYYCKCLKCNNIFCYDLLKKWLEQKQNCPTCRSIWINKIKYVNKNDT